MSKLKYIQTLGKKAKKASEELSNINNKKKMPYLKLFTLKLKIILSEFLKMQIKLILLL